MNAEQPTNGPNVKKLIAHKLSADAVPNPWKAATDEAIAGEILSKLPRCSGPAGKRPERGTRT